MRPAFVAGAVVAGTAALAHLLFALANFGLAGDEEAFFSVPLGEGILSLLAAVALGGAAVLLVRRRLFRASMVALCGTAPLPVWFAFTVPEHSDWGFLFGSLVLPLLAGAAALVSGRHRSRRESRDGARSTRPTDSPA